MRYALNGESEVHYHLKTLVRMAPWLAALRRHSQPDALVRYAEIMKPLILSAGTAHDHLAQSAKATGFYRDTGWIKLFRDPASRKDAEAMMREADAAGTHCAEISKDAMTELEPHLRPDFHTALYFKESRSVSSPGGVTKAIARSVVAHGGAFATGDAATLARNRTNTWTVQTGDGPCSAPDVVVALGPWARPLSRGSATGCRWKSSAAITGISFRPAMPACRGRWSTWTTVLSSRRWNTASG